MGVIKLNVQERTPKETVFESHVGKDYDDFVFLEVKNVGYNDMESLREIMDNLSSEMGGKKVFVVSDINDVNVYRVIPELPVSIIE